MKKFLNAFNKAIVHNKENDKKKTFQITYKKLNGRTVKRKIDPSSMRGNTVVAFDHKRNAVRSFKVERIQGMNKVAFLQGFYKQAGLVSYVKETKNKNIQFGKDEKEKINPAAERLALKYNTGSGRDWDRHYSGILKEKSTHGAKNWNEAISNYEAKLEKKASMSENLTHAAELGGLGILAAPSIKKLMGGKEMSDHNKHITEVAGLGVLAAPSLTHVAQKFLTKKI